MKPVRLVASLVLTALAGAAFARGASGGPWVQLADGTRVKSGDAGTVYVVMDGQLRPVTLGAYQALWPGFGDVVDVNSLPGGDLGPVLGEGTRMIRADGEAAVWLVDSGRRRHITSPEVMKLYRFDWGRVKVVKPDEVKEIALDRVLE